MFDSPEAAQNDMFALIADNFKQTVKPCPLRWQGKIEPEPRGYFARVSAQTVLTEQSAFALTEGPGEVPAIYTTTGLLYIQVFAPITEPDAFHFGGLLATQARDIFRGTGITSGVTYRNARRVELPFRDNDKQYRWNVIVEFEYDERQQKD